MTLFSEYLSCSVRVIDRETPKLVQKNLYWLDGSVVSKYINQKCLFLSHIFMAFSKP